MHEISKKINRSIGVLCKLRHFVKRTTVQLYYSLIYLYLTYGILIWGNTYQLTTNLLYVLKKKALRIITFFYDAYSTPLFKQVQILLITFHVTIFMYKYHTNSLPLVFNDFVKPISTMHSYNTRLASKSTYYLPFDRTNYGIFNIRYNGVKIWNKIDNNLNNARHLTMALT